MVSQELSDGLGRIGARLLKNPNSGRPGVVTLPTTFLLSPLMARLRAKLVLQSFRDNAESWGTKDENYDTPNLI